MGWPWGCHAARECLGSSRAAARRAQIIARHNKALAPHIRDAARAAATAATGAGRTVAAADAAAIVELAGAVERSASGLDRVRAYAGFLLSVIKLQVGGAGLQLRCAVV